MALQKLELRPGVNREATTYSNEGGFYSCDKIRFRSGYAEKIGGWANQTDGSQYTFNGVCRSLFNWITYENENLLGVGTNQKFYVEIGGQYYDITPQATAINLPNNPFATTNGSYGVTVTTSAPHLLYVGTYVTFSGVSGGGVVNGITLNGEFEVVQTPSPTTFVVIGATQASATGSGGGAAVVAQPDINAGNAIYLPTSGGGWGLGGWGLGGWGVGYNISSKISLWSQDNDGDNLIFNPRSGAIYYWIKDTSVPISRAVTLNSVANTQTKTTTQATFGVGVTSITVVDPNGITTGAVVSGTGIPAGTYVTTAYIAGSYTVPISAATTLASAGNYTFSYAGRHIPNNTYQILTSSVSNFTIAFGSNPYSPVDFATQFDPLLVRWSTLDNPFEWVPSTTNQAGEIKLSYGSYIVGAIDNRQEILIWTDAALFSMQYVGPPFVYSVNLLMSNISIASPNAAISVNNVTYWMGVDKFYQYSGRVETLPCSLRQFVFSDINLEQISQVVCGTNEGFNEVWWFYPTADSLVNDRYVVYNHLERLWYYGDLNRGFWLDSPLRQYPLAAFSYQKSYLSSAINSSVDIVPVINSSSYPESGVVVIDSEAIAYTGRTLNTLTGCIRGYNGTTAASHAQYSTVTYSTVQNSIVYTVPSQILNHEFGNDDQSASVAVPIDAYIETSDFDIGDGHNFGFVWRILPDLTFANSSTNSPSAVLTVKARQNSGTAYAQGDSPSVTRSADIPIELYTGQVYTRIRGRQMAFRMASSALGVAWQMGAMRLDIRPDGRR